MGKIPNKKFFENIVKMWGDSTIPTKDVTPWGTGGGITAIWVRTFTPVRIEDAIRQLLEDKHIWKYEICDNCGGKKKIKD